MLASLSTVGQAVAQTVTFDVPAGAAARTLQEFARQAGWQIIAPAALLKGVTTPPVRGVLESHAALSRLLAGAPLAVIYDEAGVIALGPRPVDPANASLPQNFDETALVGQLIVTARKQAEPLSDAPLAVSAASGDEASELGLYTLDSIDHVAPDTVVDHSFNGVNVTVRGIGTTDLTDRASPGISTVIDGVQQQSSYALDFALFDIDRVEVLRGPQGTLYGAGSPGGVINIVSNRPTFTGGLEAAAELGNFDTRRESAVLNGPVNPNLAFRLALAANDRDGYIIEPASQSKPSSGSLNSEHDASARFSALAKPDEVTSAILQFTYSHSYGLPYASAPYANLVSAHFGPAQRTGDNNPIVGGVNNAYAAVNAEFSRQFASFRTAYLFGYSEIEIYERATDTGGPKPFLNGGYLWQVQASRLDTLSQELRLQSIQAGPASWTLGFASLDYKARVFSPYYGTLGLGFPQTVGASSVRIESIDHVARQDLGLFGTAAYALGGNVRISVGLRYATDALSNRGETWAGSQTLGCPLFLLCPEAAGSPEVGSERSSTVTYRTGAEYRPKKEALFYADIATGYKPGGYNYTNSDVIGPTSFKPETLTAYELGYKGAVLKGIYLDSVAFYDDYRSYQVAGSEEISGQPGEAVAVTLSAPVIIYGGENSATYKLGPADTLTVNLNYLSATFAKGANALQAGGQGTAFVNWGGYVLNNAPRFTLGVGGRHVFRLGDGAKIILRGDTSYTSEYFVDDVGGAQQYRQAPFTRSNASVKYIPKNQAFSIEAFVSTIEDRVEQTNFEGPPIKGAGNVGITPPRFFGLRFHSRL